MDDEEEKNFFELLIEREPNVFYISLTLTISIIIAYFFTKTYFFGIFSFHEHAKIFFYFILQCISICYEFQFAIQQCDFLQITSFLTPISLFYYSLCSYRKFELILTSYDRSSKVCNKRFTRLIMGIIFLTASIEFYLTILNDKFHIKDMDKIIFFLHDESTFELIKKPIVIILYHAQAMNLLTIFNLLSFLIEIGLCLNISSLVDFIWFSKLIHELFQVFLAIHCCDSIFLAIPDAAFHSSFAIFYFWKQKRIRATIQFIKEIYFTLSEKNDYDTENHKVPNKIIDIKESHKFTNNEIGDHKNSNNNIYFNQDDDKEITNENNNNNTIKKLRGIEIKDDEIDNVINNNNQSDGEDYFFGQDEIEQNSDISEENLKNENGLNTFDHENLDD